MATIFYPPNAGRGDDVVIGTDQAVGSVVFSNSNNVTFGLSGSTVTASAGGGGAGLSAGTQSVSTGTVVFSNSNGITFGMSGSSRITASHNGLTNINVSAGTTSNVLSALTFTDGSGVSWGLNGSVVTASVATSLTNVKVSAGTSSANLSALTFTDGSNVSWGLDGSVITASVATSLTNVKVSAGTSSANLSALTFTDGSNVSWGLNGSVVTASVATSLTNIKVSAGTASANLSALTFTDGSGVSFGLNGSVITASVAGASAGIAAITAGTTNITSGNVSFANSNGVSFGANGQTITASVAAAGGFGMSMYNHIHEETLQNLITMSANIGTVVLVPFRLYNSVTQNRMRIELSRTNNGSAHYSFNAAIYTHNNATQLSRLASLQNVFVNSATGSNNGRRQLLLDGWEAAGTTLSPGKYVMAMVWSATVAGSANFMIRGGGVADGLTVSGLIGSGTDNYTTATANLSSLGYQNYAGQLTFTTATPPATIAKSDVYHTQSALNLWFVLEST